MIVDEEAAFDALKTLLDEWVYIVIAVPLNSLDWQDVTWFGGVFSGGRASRRSWSATSS